MSMFLTKHRWNIGWNQSDFEKISSKKRYNWCKFLKHYKIGDTGFPDKKNKSWNFHWLQLFASRILKILDLSRDHHGLKNHPPWVSPVKAILEAPWSSRGQSKKFKLLQQSHATNAIFRSWFYLKKILPIFLSPQKWPCFKNIKSHCIPVRLFRNEFKAGSFFNFED